jgi:hypothetical protein
MVRFVVLLLMLFIIIGCSAPAQRQPSLTVITTEGEQTKVMMQPQGDTAVFDITSPTGIGGANVQLSSGEWLPHIVLRFHLNGLEEMTLMYGDTAVTVNVSSTDSQIYQSANGETIDVHSPYWTAVSLKNEDGSAGQIPLENGTIEVTLPSDFHTQNPAGFHINWVDFFR